MNMMKNNSAGACLNGLPAAAWRNNMDNNKINEQCKEILKNARNNGSFFSTKDICQIITDKINGLEEKNKNLQNKINELSDENWKDNQLQEMKEKLNQSQEQMRYGFPVSKEENNAIAKWIEYHELEKHSSSHFPRWGAIGGCYEYRFVNTSIGTIGSIHCNCGDSFKFRELD